MTFAHNGEPAPMETTEGSLADILESFYKAFDLQDYLDQMGVVDDKVVDICRRLNNIVTDRLDQNSRIALLQVIDDINPTWREESS
jgi:hypothetical protein